MGKGTETVVKSNALIQAGYRLTLAEQRVMLSAITQIRRDEPATDEKVYSVEANALADVSGTSARRAYQELAEAAERLYRREVRIVGGANGDSEGSEGRRVTMTRWVQEITYVRDEGRVEMRFARAILPYLSTLREQFTSYQLRYVALMRSTHGIRLYELLAQWRQTGEREIELGDLRRMFGIEGQYSAVKDLRRRVIEPAVKDVNEHSDLLVRYGQRKAGRRVVAFQFQFAPKDGKQQQRRLTKDEIERLVKEKAKPGESYEDAKKRVLLELRQKPS